MATWKSFTFIPSRYFLTLAATMMICEWCIPQRLFSLHWYEILSVDIFWHFFALSSVWYLFYFILVFFFYCCRYTSLDLRHFMASKRDVNLMWDVNASFAMFIGEKWFTVGLISFFSNEEHQLQSQFITFASLFIESLSNLCNHIDCHWIRNSLTNAKKPIRNKQNGCSDGINPSKFVQMLWNRAINRKQQKY